MRLSRKMRMLHIRVTNEQFDAIDKITRGSNVSYSQVIRLIISDYLNKIEDNKN